VEARADVAGARERLCIGLSLIMLIGSMDRNLLIQRHEDLALSPASFLQRALSDRILDTVC
jgi:hypothetical protein